MGADDPDDGGVADGPTPCPDDVPFDWVGAWSERRARLSPEKVGLVDATTDRAFTYRELDAHANRTARLLREYGVADGGRVATLSRNRPELVDCFFATGKTGGVLAPLSHRLAPPELAAMLSTVDPELLLVEAPFADLARDVLGHDDCTVAPEMLVVADAEGSGSSALTVDWPRYGERLPADDSPVDFADVSLSDPQLFLHTGGSTGVPKETVVSHRSVVWNSFNTITAWGLRPEDTTPMVFPMFHTGGWNVLTVPLFHLGGTVVIAREFDPETVLRSIPEHDASVLVAVPAVLRTMCRHDDWGETDLSSLRFVKSGGGPCRESVMEAWWDRDVDLSQGYGLTECGPNNFAMPDGWSHKKSESVGVPAMHVDARVVDDDGPVPRGEVGELELAGLHAADGYWQAPTESAETFGDGWVSTGDLARVDADGYYHVVGRTKNMYVSGGENVYPPEIESVVSTHPKVEEVVVLGVPDEQWGQVGKAVVEGDEGLTLEELREFLDGKVARFKLPKHLAFVDEMPTSGPSKIDRQAVEERFGES
ncbi:fatty-acyl-CoA synthase [Halogranum amylolyticum]|uniref:Fatty-acyl-CoA synthase n=1 Tax=Halogranum amylolyticum TaxID=660520 RepID=A0A1H8TCF2_9EURY|nr:AMP-binding protein [Halogranum amylolyticum]SEO88607.1 fatty-acyl-CoA synthase [Halogranum amylolyticum]